MKHLSFKLITLLFVFLNGFYSRSTHIIGGEIYYDSIGINTYKVTIQIFRDCQSFTDFDNPLSFTVFFADGTIQGVYYPEVFSRDTLSLIDDYPCATPPDDFCVEQALYIDTVVLPFNPDGFYVVYQRCCWTASIVNIQNPSDNGITIKAIIPGSSLVNTENNSCRFINYPPLVLCSGSISTFDHSAFDPDGDSLAYSLTDPLLGGSLADIIPDPELAEPYSPVDWNPGFSTFEQLGTAAVISIDPFTGLITFNPNLVGMFVVGVEVREYRDNVLIQSKIRTYGYRVVACETSEAPQVDVFGSQQTVENCGESGFIITRTNTGSEIAFNIEISGTATNSIDYSEIPDSVVFEIGQDTIFVSISTFEDELQEGQESVTLEIIWEDPCTGTIDTNSFTLLIDDYVPMSITAIDSVNICDELQESAFLWSFVQNGIPPYNYTWNPPGFANNDTISINGDNLVPNLNIFFVIASDQCGNNIISPVIRAYEQCPIAAPNVMTSNGDGINDFFIVKNLNDFDKIEVIVYNRWGNVVFETDDYKNDWQGTDKTGAQLSDGVYFYTVTPTSEKYEYDDSKRSLYTVQGFVHLFSK
jgi:gliding motility-associated-like protein